MLLWTYPGTVIGPCDRAVFAAELDLGMRWRHPTLIRIAGINPYRGTPAAQRVTDLLPEGTPFLIVTEHAGHDDTLRAHVALADGTDIASLVKHQRPEIPVATYGGDWAGTWRYPATVLRVCDADTVRVSLDMGVPTRLDANVRVGHVNAPEAGTAEGQAATVYAEQLLQPGIHVDLHSRGLDKYGRPLADVRLPDGGDYGRRLINAGHAVPYEGGRR